MTQSIRLLFAFIALTIATTSASPWRHYSDEANTKIGEMKEKTTKYLETWGRKVEGTQIFVEKTAPKPNENKVPEAKSKDQLAWKPQSPQDDVYKLYPEIDLKWKKVKDVSADEEEEMLDRKSKDLSAMPKVVYDDSELTDDAEMIGNGKEPNSGDGLYVKQDRTSPFEQPRDADEYKLAYQRKKIALYTDAEFKDGNFEKMSENPSKEEKRSVEAVKPQKLTHGSVEYVKKTESEEEYDDEDYDEEEEEEKELKSSEKKEEEEEVPVPPVYSSFPRRVPPLYLPSSIPSSSRGSDRSEETAERDETEEDKNRTLIDVPYRYMPLPVIDPLGYALAYPWLSVKEIADTVEDAFVSLRKDTEEEGVDDSSQPEELKSEVVDIEGKRYLLKTRSIKIGAEGDDRAYVSLVSLTPYKEEADEEEMNAEDKVTPTLFNKKNEEEMMEKETKKKERKNKKRQNIKKEEKSKDLNDSDSD